MLAVEAADRHPGPTSNDAVIAAMDANFELRALGGDRGRVTALAVSPDGLTVATADDGDHGDRPGFAALLWDIETGRLRVTIPLSNTVGAVRFTPESRRLVTHTSSMFRSASGRALSEHRPKGMPSIWEPKVSLWDVTSGRKSAESADPVVGLPTWRINAARSIDLSPDGRLVVVTSGLDPGHPPRILDLDEGTVVATLEGHDAPVIAVAYSPDGRTIATGSADLTARVWDAATGKELHRLVGHKEPVHFVAYRPDGRRLVTLGDHGFMAFPGFPPTQPSDGTTGRLWDVATGKEVATLRWPRRPLSSEPGVSFGTSQQVGDSQVAHFSPDGRSIYTVPGALRFGGLQSGHPAVWDAETGAFRLSLTRDDPRAIATNLALSADGRKVAIGYDDGLVRLVDPSGLTIRAFKGASLHLAFTPDGRRLVSTSQVWDARIGDEVDFTRRVWTDVERMTFSPDGRIAAVEVYAPLAGPARPDERPNRERQWARSIEFRDTADGRLISTTGTRPSPTDVRLRFSPDGRLLVIPELFKGMALIDVATGQQVGNVGPVEVGVENAAFSPDSRTLALAADDLYLYDVATRREALKIPGAYGGRKVYREEKILFSPDGSMILTVSNQDYCRLWDPRDGRKLAEFTHAKRPEFDTKERIEGAEFSPDGRRLLSLGNNSTVRIWDVATKVHLLALAGPAPIATASFSADGHRVLTVDRDKNVLIWDAQTGRERGRINGLDGVAEALFSPDGRVILTTGGDRSVRLWDGQTGRAIATLVRDQGLICSRGFSPDSRHVWLSFNDNRFSTRAWPVDFLTEARARCPRELTPAERVRFELSTP